MNIITSPVFQKNLYYTERLTQFRIYLFHILSAFFHIQTLQSEGIGTDV